MVTKIWRLRNGDSAKQVISEGDLDKVELTQIKRQEFSRLMNIHYSKVKHNWEFNGNKFRKLDNFESTDYVLGKDVPLHDLGALGRCLLVYHWGRVYYHTISYNGYPQGQLIDVNTLKIHRWTKLKHCAPIFNTKEKTIV